ncbi:hypothetical protein B0J12DRAFT_150571 [Macrophomina phaseolina]|uniref:Uncharacterized protein n=1 Tax=Macrophomina phaseolina TaxID=35725 RepID=A0ABQ8G7D6_9PEZI|nr:hypothetical protein B0J12DRAFT_150571 [Macrophomina phaseolina]
MPALFVPPWLAGCARALTRSRSVGCALKSSASPSARRPRQRRASPRAACAATEYLADPGSDRQPPAMGARPRHARNMLCPTDPSRPPLKRLSKTGRPAPCPQLVNTPGATSAGLLISLSRPPHPPRGPSCRVLANASRQDVSGVSCAPCFRELGAFVYKLCFSTSAAGSASTV